MINDEHRKKLEKHLVEADISAGKATNCLS